jgi:sugar/nucleoside kinase (ribokinase family)
MNPIVIVGSMAFDDLELPRPIADPDRAGHEAATFENVIGGAATYAALAASCYTPTRIVAVVGDDFPEAVLSHLRSRGIDTLPASSPSSRAATWIRRSCCSATSIRACSSTCSSRLAVKSSCSPIP